MRVINDSNYLQLYRTRWLGLRARQERKVLGVLQALPDSRGETERAGLQDRQDPSPWEMQSQDPQDPQDHLGELEPKVR